jgi:hypothetical protein
MAEPVTVEVGPDANVTITKMFGPTAASDLRITFDMPSCCWVVERQWALTGKFMEWVRIPAQIEAEYPPD